MQDFIKPVFNFIGKYPKAVCIALAIIFAIPSFILFLKVTRVLLDEHQTLFLGFTGCLGATLIFILGAIAFRNNP